MLRLTARRRAVFGEKFLDLANYAATALVFAQFVSEQQLWAIMLAAAGMWLVLAAVSFLLTGEP